MSVANFLDRMATVTDRRYNGRRIHFYKGNHCRNTTSPQLRGVIFNSNTASSTRPVSWLFQCVRRRVRVPDGSPWVTPKSPRYFESGVGLNPSADQKSTASAV